MNKKKIKVYIAGHNGMVGSAIYNNLLKDPKYQIIARSKKELNLINQKDVDNFFRVNKIDQVYVAAAKVGGIYANNKFPADFIYHNLMIQNNIIHSAFRNDVKKLLFLGSSCIYPKNIKQPMKENSLMTGKLEETNEAYAIAKIAGIKMCESYNRQYKKLDYRSIMPTNLYGPNHNYHPINSHVIPGLINRFHNAKKNNLSKVKVWGSGKVKREFLYVEDLAKAATHIMSLKKIIFRSITSAYQSHVNVGSGTDISIEKLAKKIAKVVEYKGIIVFDDTYPDGVKRKLLNSEVLKKTGWKPKINLDEGLYLTYKEFLKNL